MNSKSKQKKVQKAVDSLNDKLKGKYLSDNLEDNISLLKELFKEDETIIFRPIKSAKNNKLSFYIVHCDGITNPIIINQHIIHPLMALDDFPQGNQAIDRLKDEVICINQVEKTKEIKKIIQGITCGDTLLLAANSAEGLILNTKGFETRAISEPEGEKVLNGPREGFTESLMVNLSLIRRKINTNELKMKFITVGEQTQTRICITYIDSIVNKEVLKKLEKRLEKIQLDAVMEENYIIEQIRDNPLSPFRVTGITERPDIVIARLLEGRIAILTDGSPTTSTIPYLFIENFQSNEDYYMNYYYTSFSRLLRIFAFLLTILVPALYVIFLTYHHEMVPPKLLISITVERQDVPLPIPLEAVLLLIMFEVLRETGVRMPSSIGQALSIVGALVIGQSAVEAKLVSASMIIVIAFTGITGLVIPKMNSPVIFTRIFLLILSALFGFLGFGVGLSLVIIHIINLKSFGIPQLTLDNRLREQEIKDSFIRFPWWKMKSRPSFLSKNKTRSNSSKGQKS